MKGETFVDKSDDLLFYIQKVFFMMINIRKLERRSNQIQYRLRGAVDEEFDDILEAPTNLSSGNDFITDVLSATTSHSRCHRFPVASRYRIEFLRFFQSLLQNEDLQRFADADSKIRKELEDLGHHQRVGIGGWQLHDEASSLSSTGIQAEDAYKTHILTNGKHPVTVFESADAVDQEFGTTGLSTWTASIVLNDWIVLNSHLFKDKRILELGCGIGLTGLVTILECEPTSYVFTDYHDKVISRCQEHVDLNLQHASDLDLKTKTETKCLDWAQFDPANDEYAWLDDPFDVVIGSDIIYHPSIIPPLVNVLKHALTAKRRRNEVLRQTEAEVEKPIAYISAAVRKPTTFDYFVLCLKNSSMEVDEVPEEDFWETGQRDFFNFSDVDANFRILKITDDSCDEEKCLLRGN